MLRKALYHIGRWLPLTISGFCVAGIVGEAYFGLTFTFEPWVVAFVALYAVDHKNHRMEGLAVIAEANQRVVQHLLNKEDHDKPRPDAD